jgi:hypothetical protein
MLTKEQSNRGNFNSQVDRMTLVSGACYSFFQPLLPFSKELMQKVTMVAGKDHKHGLLVTKTNLDTVTAEHPICQQQRLTPDP